MVVANFDVERVAIDEPKTNTPLVIDGNRVLALPIILQRVQPISWWHSEVVKLRCQIHVLQFPDSTSRDVCWESFGLPIEEQIACAAVGKRLDHSRMYRVT